MKRKIMGLTLSPILYALCSVGALLFALSFPANAQQPVKIPWIGFLGGSSALAYSSFIEAFRQGLRELGYVEGKNIVIEYRFADGRTDRLPELAAELLRLKMDIMVAGSTSGALAAKSATSTIPIVFFGVSDPVVAGLVNSLARPGGNITGVTSISALLAGKRLELLKETILKLSRVAVLWNPPDPSSAQQWKESQLPARELGLQLHSMDVSSADKYDSAFSEAVKARSGALAVTLHPWPLPIKNRSRTWRQKMVSRRYTPEEILSRAAA